MDFGMAFGPLAYLHVRSLKKTNYQNKFKTYIHFLPSLLLDGVLFTSIFLYIRANRDWGEANIQNIQSFALVIIALGLVQLAIYTYFIYKEIKSINTIPKEFPAIRKWFKTIAIVWIVIIGFLMIAVPIALFNIELLDNNSHLFYRPVGIILGLCIYGLGYLYVIKYINPINSYFERLANVKYSESELEDRKQKIVITLKENKLYQDHKLTVSKLADHLHWPINDVSMIINETFSTNFNDFINGYRVEAFKEVANDVTIKKYSILGLAQEVGFGSKASFYRAFKKEMGITPNEYLKPKT